MNEHVQNRGGAYMIAAAGMRIKELRTLHEMSQEELRKNQEYKEPP